ncbi:MAG: gamma-glutamyltransferase [Candidatus Sericytochromatia bacterium]
MKKNILLSVFTASFLVLNNNFSIGAVRTPKEVKNGMVASDHYLASQAGAEVLKKGGNAFDAAVATSLVLSVVRNQSTGIGGGGFMVIHTAKGEEIVIDYRETAPKKAFKDMYLDKNKKPIPKLSTQGYKAVAVPGNLAGLDYVLKKYGTKKLNELIEPAIKYAEKGYLTDKHFSEATKTVFERGAEEGVKKYYFNNLKPRNVNETVKNIELANTLKLISKNGIKEFYSGSIAQKIAKDMSNNGGLITLEDLKNYKPKIRKPIKGNYRGYDIVSMPPPSSGGTALIETLNILENFNIGWNSTGFGSSKHVHLVTEAMKHSFSDRAEYMGDPDFVKIPLNVLTSKEHAKQIAKTIDFDKTKDIQEYGSKKYIPADSGTTHYSVVDKFGNIVAATETVNTLFGSQVVIKDTGILMNNEMDDFVVQTGVPNAFGLIGNDNNSIQPNKKPLSSMTPTIILKNGKPFMAVGASGGPRIITGTLHAIINVIDFGMNIEEAVSYPRFHHQWAPNKLFIEQDMPEDVRLALKNKGHELTIGKAESAVQAILIKDGNISGASDPRKGGFPEGY